MHEGLHEMKANVDPAIVRRLHAAKGKRVNIKRGW